MAKVADVFGRTEAFLISMLLYVLGYIQQAASRDIGAYASAQIFYAAGSTGLRILQQIFIADTSDLLNRALLSSLPDTPFLVTVWIGPEISGALGTPHWRWGYGMWYVISCCLFLFSCRTVGLLGLGLLLLLFCHCHCLCLSGSINVKLPRLVFCRRIHGDHKGYSSFSGVCGQSWT